MKKIRTLIVDDEPLAREGIRLLLQKEERFEIIEECVNGKEALTMIQKHLPQLIFLDVQMPEMNGFEMLAKIDQNFFPVIIFVTAYDNYALQAFDAQAIDYLLKPFSNQRFYQALNRAKLQLANQQVRFNNKRLRRLLAEYQKQQPVNAETLVIKSGNKIIFVKPLEIVWIEATDYYITLHLTNKKYLLRETMKQFENKLDKKQFVRIHRSSIVNIKQIRELHRNNSGGYQVILKNGIKLSLSRRRYDIFVSTLNSISSV